MKLVLSALLLLASPAFASSIKITEGQPTQFKTVRIEAQKVKGVAVQLKTEVIRNDCNHITLNANAVRVSGNEVNWWATFFVTTSLMQTEMYCPRDPVKEIVESEKIAFESYSNPNLDGAVDITLIVPVGYKVVASELK